MYIHVQIYIQFISLVLRLAPLPPPPPPPPPPTAIRHSTDDLLDAVAGEGSEVNGEMEWDSPRLLVSPRKTRPGLKSYKSSTTSLALTPDQVHRLTSRLHVHVLVRDEKEERSKQGQTNNKAKQHSTPRAVTFPKKNELPRVGL